LRPLEIYQMAPNTPSCWYHATRIIQSSRAAPMTLLTQRHSQPLFAQRKLVWRLP